MLFQRRDIGYGITAEHHVFLADESDAHAAVHVERARDDARAVELLVDDARADREAVQADDKAEQRGAVAHLYGFRHIEHAQQLLGKIERVAIALLEHKVGVGAQLIERDARPGGERVVSADENVRLGGEQLLEHKLVFAQQLGEYALVALAQVEQTELTPAGGNIVDDLAGLRLTQDEAVPVGVVLLHYIDKGVDRERIMLA